MYFERMDSPRHERYCYLGRDSAVVVAHTYSNSVEIRRQLPGAYTKMEFSADQARAIAAELLAAANAADAAKRVALGE